MSKLQRPPFPFSAVKLLLPSNQQKICQIENLPFLLQTDVHPVLRGLLEHDIPKMRGEIVSKEKKDKYKLNIVERNEFRLTEIAEIFVVKENAFQRFCNHQNAFLTVK